MAREDFLVNLRNAAFFLRMNATPDSQPWGSGQEVKALLGKDVWLKPRSVAGFEVADFPELSEAEKRELQHEVAHFLSLTSVSSPVFSRSAATAHETAQQVRAALAHFQRIVELTGKAVLAEWKAALDRFFLDAENWSRERDWGVKRDMKRLEEEILGEYEVPRLLIHTLENQRFFLEPVGRQIYSATGRVDLCMIPSEDSIGIYRTDKGWFLVSEGSSDRKRPWTRGTFYKTLDRLAKAA